MNNEAIIKRLGVILEHYELSAAAFADKINVQRSSISHLLNGRNKPSLDFVIKIDEAFFEVDLNWLLYGKGSFPANPLKNIGETIAIEKSLAENQPRQSPNKPVERIVIFYKDGSFKSFTEE